MPTSGIFWRRISRSCAPLRVDRPAWCCCSGSVGVHVCMIDSIKDLVVSAGFVSESCPNSCDVLDAFCVQVSVFKEENHHMGGSQEICSLFASRTVLHWAEQSPTGVTLKDLCQIGLDRILLRNLLLSKLQTVLD